jgi:monoamine oxidase
MFLNRVGSAGGYGATYLAMQAMGLLPEALAYSGPPAMPEGAGAGISVVILGAGLAGMTACYELRKAGYECTVLEARDRAGGRNWTIRGGDRVEEIGGAAQTCEFDSGLYFNPGPARIPSQHRAVLGYCKELGVPLEVFVNANRNAWFQDEQAFGGQPIEARQLHHDTAGHVSELLVKAVDGGALDEELSGIDKRRLRVFLIQYGALDRDLKYKGSSRSGFDVIPGAAFEAGEMREPLEFRALVDSRFWYWHMYFEKNFEQQATMLQPVGGMARIGAAFARRLGELIRYRSIVKEIRKTAAGVRVVYHEMSSGTTQEVEADYCICTLPLPVLAGVEADFSPHFKRAINAGSYAPACKLAWEAKRRFWEDDHGIYGGISWTQREITQLWYPSSGYHADKGVLIGAYNFSSQAAEFGRLSPGERARVARTSGALMHPQMETQVGKAISVAWRNIPFSVGAYSSWSSVGRQQIYPVLNTPDGAIYLAGEHLSHWTSWQEGAVLSAHHVIGAVNARVQAGRA